jgi:hypothetical protein
MVCSEDGSAGRRACSAAVAAVAAQAAEAVRSQLQEHVMSQRGIRPGAVMTTVCGPPSVRCSWSVAATPASRNDDNRIVHPQ